MKVDTRTVGVALPDAPEQDTSDAPAVFEQTASDLVPISGRERILNFERELAKIPQYEFPTKHHFPAGLYAREIFIPAGYCLTGKIHRFENLNIVSRGRILIHTEEGVEEVVAPATIVSPPGTKRIGYALEDTVWSTILPNPTNERDIAKLEKMLVVDRYEDLD